MNSAEKALAACKEYDRLLIAIKRNTEDIGNGLDVCNRWVDDASGRHMPGGTHHLSEAFAPYEDDGAYSPVNQYNDEPAILEIIGDCDGCLTAYKAVQERKANRKQLGIIKRSIRLIGRAA